MKTLLYVSLFICSLLLNFGCNPTSIPSADLKSVTNPPSGGNPNLLPSNCRVGQVPTTASGCVSLVKVNQFNLANQYSIIGFTRYQSGDAVLLERSNGAFKVWDLFSLPDSTQSIASVVPICSFTKPGGYYDNFGGLNFSNGAFHTIAENVNGATRIYDISVSSCTASAGLVLQVTSNNCSYLTEYLLFDGTSYIYSFSCAVNKQFNANLATLVFGANSVAGYTGHPDSSSLLTLATTGDLWFVSQYTSRLWHVDKSLTPVSWVELPQDVYSDLYNVSGITWVSSNHIHILTMQSQSSLKDFDFDLTNFNGGAP